MKLTGNPELLTLLEDDLKQKVQAVIDADPQLRMGVHGVFSLDDLENKMAVDLGNDIGVGVQYGKTTRAAGDVGRMYNHMFTLILAVPSHDTTGDERRSASRLLQSIANSVNSTPTGSDPRQRCWEMLSMGPELGASSDTMLYYSQVWQIAIPHVSKPA